MNTTVCSTYVSTIKQLVDEEQAYCLCIN